MSSVSGMILQWGSTIKVSMELPVATRPFRDMTEKLLKAMLNPNKQQQKTPNACFYMTWPYIGTRASFLKYLTVSPYQRWSAWNLALTGSELSVLSFLWSKLDFAFNNNDYYVNTYRDLLSWINPIFPEVVSSNIYIYMHVQYLQIEQDISTFMYISSITKRKVSLFHFKYLHLSCWTELACLILSGITCQILERTRIAERGSEKFNIEFGHI